MNVEKLGYSVEKAKKKKNPKQTLSYGSGENF